MATVRSEELLPLARRVAGAVPPEPAQEILVTGSTSRGVADEWSDVEMLIASESAREHVAQLLEQLG